MPGLCAQASGAGFRDRAGRRDLARRTHADPRGARPPGGGGGPTNRGGARAPASLGRCPRPRRRMARRGQVAPGVAARGGRPAGCTRTREVEERAIPARVARWLPARIRLRRDCRAGPPGRHALPRPHPALDRGPPRVGTPGVPAAGAVGPGVAGDANRALAGRISNRYTRLSAELGSWRLAWLEALLKAADAWVSSGRDA